MDTPLKPPGVGQFRCDRCGKVEDLEVSEAEVREEAIRKGIDPDDDPAVVCDECYAESPWGGTPVDPEARLREAIALSKKMATVLMLCIGRERLRGIRGLLATKEATPSLRQLNEDEATLVTVLAAIAFDEILIGDGAIGEEEPQDG